MLRRRLDFAGGSGSAWSSHFEPFQRSARATPTPSGVVMLPTARQLVDERQAVLARVETSASSGIGCRDHSVPFEPSAKGLLTPPALYSPTAVQNASPAHPTPFNRGLSPLGLGNGWRLQARSVVNVWSSPFRTKPAVLVATTR